MSSSSSLGELRTLLQKFYKVAVRLDEEQQGSLLSMFQDAYQNVIQSFDIDEAILESDEPTSISRGDQSELEGIESEARSHESFEYDNEEKEEASYANDNEDYYPEERVETEEASYEDHPETDEAGEQYVDAPIEDNAYDTEDFTISAKDLERFKEVELFLGEKLYLQGRGANDVFTRFDTVGTGCVTVEEFRAAIALLGIALLDDEVRIFKKKFASDDHPGMIDYHTFMRYVEALRSRRPRDLTTSAIARRPVMTPQATRELLAKVKVPLLTRLQRGLKLVREYLYIHSKAISQVYKALKNGRGEVEIATLVKNLTSYGFPRDLVADEELSAYLRETAGVDGDLSYNDFARLMQGHPEIANEEDPAPRNLLTDPTFISVLVKLNSIHLRAHFKQMDTDMDDQVSIQQVIDDLAALGLTKEICKLPELNELISRFSIRNPGFLQFSEFLQFVNARVSNLPSAIQVTTQIEIPATASLQELVSALHNHTKKGISLDSVFSQLAPLRSRSITETDLWHGLTMIGFIIPKELNEQFFNLFALVDGASEPAIDYKDVTLTVLQPTRNPRLNASVGEAVPLGSAISNVHEFAAASNVAAAASAARKVGRVSGSEPHRHGSQVFGDDSSQNQQAELDDNRSGSRRLGLNTRSSVRFGDLTEEELAASARGVRKSEASTRMTAHNKGHIDFGGDHGAKASVSRNSSARAPQTTVNLSHELTEQERSRQAADLAERQRTSYKTASDIFNTKESGKPATQSKPKGPISNVSFDYSEVQRDRTPEETAAAVSSNLSRQPGAMGLALQHDEDKPAPATASVTGYARKGTGLGAKDSLDLRFDPDSAKALSAAKSGRRTYEDHVGARDHVEGLRNEMSLDEQLNHQVEMQHEAQRRARASGANKPISSGPPFAGQNSAETDQLIAELDRRILSPRTKSKASAATPAAPHSSVDPLVEDEPRQLDHEYLLTLSREIYTKGKVRSVFSEWAQGGTSLSKEQLASGAAKLLFPIPDGQVDLIFDAYDREGKGSLGYADFMRMLSARQ